MQVGYHIRAMVCGWRSRVPTWRRIDHLTDIYTWMTRAYSSLLPIFVYLGSSTRRLGVEDGFFDRKMKQKTRAADPADAQSGITRVVFRGYNEMAHNINTFAHAGRKMGLFNVASMTLDRIYTLPNIEIVDAFEKFSEHAKIHLGRHERERLGRSAPQPLFPRSVAAVRLRCFTGRAVCSG